MWLPAKRRRRASWAEAATYCTLLHIAYAAQPRCTSVLPLRRAGHRLPYRLAQHPARREILADHAMIPQQNFALTVGKNGSDIALVIDAVDLLHSGRFAGCRLVSSDSDFTRLAARVREQGFDVFVFGAAKTPKSFRKACKRFVLTGNLLPQPQSPAIRRQAAPLRRLLLHHGSLCKRRLWSDARSRNWRRTKAGSPRTARRRGQI
ncbi:NYN domain-containing protein [Sphingomonas sp. S1-29]|uniref:NYN domain-containing protein n=1 Tax=Sphingomonas sp. S1-29 TaxID=2991074 RepID=UPI0022401D80|nr:NYN domain-containing protein [Sphingomonas sp. S1-29]UZK69768.1 NYN domain-containing protein [Sphingomonas sp. S1-29]